MGWYCPRCGQETDAGGSCPRDGAELARISTHDLLGRQLGEYTVVARLGGGAFGHVFRAVHPRSGLVVAIKLLNQPADPRIVTEARAAASIRHPNVVQVYDLGQTLDGRPYIVMELLDGRALPWHQRTAVGDALHIADCVLRGLGAAHRLGVVHRDLKPENVLVTDAGRVVIVDFGLAKLLADPKSPNLTVTGESLGTPRYMSPEQIRGRPVDGRTDLYALGVMMFEALAGAPPFDASSTFQLFQSHLEHPPPELPEHVPPGVAAAIDRALAKDPAARFADADEMRRALTRPRRRRRWPYAVAAAAVVAVVVTVAAIQTSAPPAPPPPVAVDGDLDDASRNALALYGDNLAKHVYSRAQQVELVCTTERGLAGLGSAGDPGSRRTAAFLKAIAAVFRSYAPDIRCPPAR